LHKAENFRIMHILTGVLTYTIIVLRNSHRIVASAVFVLLIADELLSKRGNSIARRYSLFIYIHCSC